jgi:hypothetical protein
MALRMSSFCRLAVSTKLQPAYARGIHIDVMSHRDKITSEIVSAMITSSDMISSGTHSSTERINRFMNAVYVNNMTSKTVTLFSFNYRQQKERTTIRGVSIGTNSRRPGMHKNVVVVSGLPLQDPSLIGVGLYVAAMVARLSPMLPRDVSVIPLAYPKEYEERWRAAHAIRFGSERLDLPLSAHTQDANWLEHENITLDLKGTTKPLETFITRKNKYFVNIDVDLTTRGSSMQYKSNSLSHLASLSKHRSFLLDRSPPSIPLPSCLTQPSNSTTNSNTPFSHSQFSYRPDSEYSEVLAPILENPTLVLELKGMQSLDDEQVVARGEEVISMLKELLA